MNCKKAFAIIASLLLIISGIVLIYAYSTPIQLQETLAQSTLTVPANNYGSVAYDESLSGDYKFQIDSPEGTIEAFWSKENSTYTWINATQCEIRDLPEYCDFNGSSGEFEYTLLTYGEEKSAYLFCYNPDSFDKEVSYSIHRTSNYNNSAGLVTGIIFLVAGIIALCIGLLKNKLQEFNKAVENDRNSDFLMFTNP